MKKAMILSFGASILLGALAARCLVDRYRLEKCESDLMRYTLLFARIYDSLPEESKRILIGNQDITIERINSVMGTMSDTLPPPFGQTYSANIAQFVPNDRDPWGHRYFVVCAPWPSEKRSLNVRFVSYGPDGYISSDDMSQGVLVKAVDAAESK